MVQTGKSGDWGEQEHACNYTYKQLISISVFKTQALDFCVPRKKNGCTWMNMNMNMTVGPLGFVVRPDLRTSQVTRACTKTSVLHCGRSILSSQRERAALGVLSSSFRPTKWDLLSHGETQKTHGFYAMPYYVIL